LHEFLLPSQQQEKHNQVSPPEKAIRQEIALLNQVLLFSARETANIPVLEAIAESLIQPIRCGQQHIFLQIFPY
jgi:hypothetical protein